MYFIRPLEAGRYIKKLLERFYSPFGAALLDKSYVLISIFEKKINARQSEIETDREIPRGGISYLDRRKENSGIDLNTLANS